MGSVEAPCLEPTPIAVIGIGCRLPGGVSSPDEFWDLLEEGRSTYSVVPPNRYNVDAFHDSTGTQAHTITPRGGHFLAGDPAAWDAPFFNISPVEAKSMDPLQRLMLEVAFEAFENAGLRISDLSGSATGCYVGSFANDYAGIQARDPEIAPTYTATGIGFSVISNRISWFYDLKGPSLTLDTACSSSLVALHLACQSLQSGDAKMAIAAGTSIMLSPDWNIWLSNLNFLAPDGLSKSFDASANGYGRGEGFAALILKPLDDAIRDGDMVRAVIRNTGVGQDGRTPTITKPSSEAQADLIRSTYNRAGLDRRRTRYFEAHGTGTAAGDPLEFEAIAKAFGTANRDHEEFFIGSVKSNIGHLEGTAGLAGVIKSILILERGIIPANLHFDKPNPRIPFAASNIRVPTSPTRWPTKGLRRISVNSFGYGGTNSHVVLDDAGHYLAEHNMKGSHNTTMELTVAQDLTFPQNDHLRRHSNLDGHSLTNGRSFCENAEDRPPGIVPQIFILSAQDQSGVDRVCKAHADYIRGVSTRTEKSDEDQTAFLHDLAFTLNSRRSHLYWKSFKIGSTLQNLSQALHSTSPVCNRVSTSPRIGFVFTGQGAQWPRMGLELMYYPVFKKSILAADEYLRAMGASWSAVVELDAPSTESRINQSRFSQPLCTIVQIAIVDLLHSWGVIPSAVVGHSSGEIAAAYCWGAISCEDAWKIAYIRGALSYRRSQDESLPRGSMLAVGKGLHDVQKYIEDVRKGKVVIACINSPSSTTVSGDVAGIAELQDSLVERSIFVRRLKVDNAYHSHHMEAVAQSYLEALRECVPKQPWKTMKMSSSVTGKTISAADLGPEYWVTNLLSQVRFSEALMNILTQSHKRRRAGSEIALDLLVEIGPHSALEGPAKQIMADQKLEGISYQSVLLRDKDSIKTALSCAGTLFINGAPVDIERINNPRGTRLSRRLLIDLPTYAWDHSRAYWAESRRSKRYRFRSSPRRALLGTRTPDCSDIEPQWRNYLRASENPWIPDHQIQGSILYPAAGMLAMVLEAARQVADVNQELEIFHFRDVRIGKAIIIPQGIEEVETVLQLRFKPGHTNVSNTHYAEFVVLSCSEGEELQENCSGFVSIQYKSPFKSEPAALEVKLENDRYRQTYHDLKRKCDMMEEPSSFYKKLLSFGLEYGPTFRNMVDIRHGENDSCCTVAIPDTRSIMPAGVEDQHLLHPATLDTMFHAMFAAMSSTNGGLTGAAVPTFIGSIGISASLPSGAGSQFCGFSRISSNGPREVTADITMGDSNLTAPVITIEKLTCMKLNVGSTGIESDNVMPANRCMEVADVPDLSLASPSQLQHLLNDTSQDSLTKECLMKIDPETSRAVAKIAKYIKLRTLQNPNLSILGVGSGAAEIAETVSCALMSGSESASYHPTYTITTTEDDFVTASQPLSNGSAHVDHEHLDSDQVSGNHSFKSQSYDIIIAKDMSLAGDNCSRALDHIQTLLKPEAQLLLVVSTYESEASSTDATHCFNAWNKLLTQHAFTDISSTRDAGVQRYELIISTKKRQESIFPNPIHVLQPHHISKDLLALTTKLTNEFASHKISVQPLAWKSADGSSPLKDIVALIEIEKPLLFELSKDEFSRIKNTLLGASRILWVTRGDDPASSVIFGLARTIQNENPHIDFRVLHLDQATTLTSEGALHSISTTFLARGQEKEFHEKDGLIHVDRLFCQDNISKDLVRFGVPVSPEGMRLGDLKVPVTLETDASGLFGNPFFTPDASMRGTIVADAVEFEVKAVGLNSHDQMIAAGQSVDMKFGLEASGTVVKVGHAVQSFKPGDRIAVAAYGLLGNVARAKELSCRHIPESMPFEDAAAIPMVFGTAYHALVNVANVRAGQSVLVHSGSSPIGQAAIQIAQHLGARIFATVSGDDERDILMESYGLPTEHILSNGDLSFAKGIMRLTQGKGVDMALNSLSGEALRLTWQSVAPLGSLVNVTAKDALENSQLDLGPSMKKGVTFAFVDLELYLSNQVEVIGDLMGSVFQLFEKNVCRPIIIPSAIFPASDIVGAIRSLHDNPQASKPVISFSNDDIVPVNPTTRSPLILDPNSTIILVGGLGGLGRSLARFLATNGAQNLAFISRSGARSDKSKAYLDELQHLGINCRVYRCDIADHSALKAVLDQCSQEMPKIIGVVQMAMSLDDSIFETMTYEQWINSTRPKIQGSRNLHDLLDSSLSFFIMLSSVSGLSGNPGQANYAAGGTYQDALASYRRKKGLAGLSIDLGVMLDIGYVAELEKGLANLASWEVSGVHEAEFISLMKWALTDGTKLDDPTIPSQIVLGCATGGQVQRSQKRNNKKKIPPPFYHSDPRFSHVVEMDLSSSSSSSSSSSNSVPALSTDGSIQTTLSSATTYQEANKIVLAALVERVAAYLHVPTENIDTNQALHTYNVDSLVAVELRNWMVGEEVKAEISLFDVLGNSSMKKVAEKIVDSSKLVQVQQ